MGIEKRVSSRFAAIIKRSSSIELGNLKENSRGSLLLKNYIR